jgi:hypothetical protein
MTDLEVLEKKFKAHVEYMADSLAKGSCKDFGEYQRMCGVIYGLGLALTDLQDLRKNLERYEAE